MGESAPCAADQVVGARKGTTVNDFAATDARLVIRAAFASIGKVEWLTNDGLPVLARIVIVWIFPFSFIDKIINWNGALKQASSGWLPGGPVLLVLAMIVELCTPPMIVFGFYDGIAAFVLAGYCAVTGVVYHAFWAYRRFWSPDSEGYPHIWDFFKNFGLVGGLIYVMYDAGFIQAVGSEVEQVSMLTGLQ